MIPTASGPWELLFNRFVQYHAFTSLGHLFKLVRRVSTLDSLLWYNDQYEFTPGFFLPGIFNFLISYFLFAIITILLVLRPDSSFLRRAWLPLAFLHFLAIPLRVPNHYIVVVLAAIVIFLAEVALRGFRGSSSNGSPWNSTKAFLSSLSSSPSSSPPSLSTWLHQTISSEEVYQTAITAIKVLYTFTYGFATLHKLNYAYFNSAETPVRRIFRPIFLSVGWKDYPQDSMWYLPLAAGSIWIEGTMSTVPWLQPWQRRWVLMQGLFFHCMTVLAGAPDYSVIIVSFYPLFTDDPIEPLRRNWKVVLACLPTTLLFFRCSFLFSNDYHPPKNSLFWHVAEPFEYISVLLFFQSWIALLYLNRTAPTPSSPFALPFTSSSSSSSSSSSPSGGTTLLPTISTGASGLTTYQQLTELRGIHMLPRRWAKTFVIVFALVYGVNCMGPYLGAKFEWSQAMYSNLRYDGSNHLFLPTLNSKENIYLYDVVIQPARNVSSELLSYKRALPELMRGGTQQRHFFWSGIRALCRRTELRPIKTDYNEFHTKITHEDACDHVPSWPPLWWGLYPPKAKLALLGL